MLLRTRTQLLLVSLAVAACGPESNATDDANDWMIGTFSNREIGDMSIGLSGVGHYVFESDGLLLVGGVHDCSQNLESDSQEHRWKKGNSDGSIVVQLPASESGVDAWQFRAMGACDSIYFEELRQGVVVGVTSLTRGAVCLSDALPPCADGTSCETCKTVWCDEDPPACE